MNFKKAHKSFYTSLERYQKGKAPPSIFPQLRGKISRRKGGHNFLMNMCSIKASDNAQRRAKQFYLDNKHVSGALRPLHTCTVYFGRNRAIFN
jgi:hypothetical protein